MTIYLAGVLNNNNDKKIADKAIGSCISFLSMSTSI